MGQRRHAGSAWDDLMAKLTRERDELALKLHLGKEEARAEWEKLEAKWKELKTVKGTPVQGGRRGDGARGRLRARPGGRRAEEGLRKDTQDSLG